MEHRICRGAKLLYCDQLCFARVSVPELRAKSSIRWQIWISCAARKTPRRVVPEGGCPRNLCPKMGIGRIRPISLIPPIVMFTLLVPGCSERFQRYLPAADSLPLPGVGGRDALACAHDGGVGEFHLGLFFQVRHGLPSLGIVG